MKALSLTLLFAGTALATSFAARTVDAAGSSARLSAWWSAAGLEFSASLAVMIVGMLLARRRRRPHPREASPASGATARQGFEQIVARVAQLPDVGGGGGSAQSLADGLDDVLQRLVPDFVERRAELVDELGLLGFARVMSPFASFERNAARAWSALADDAFGEAQASLDVARASLAEAHALLSPRN